MGRQVFQHWSIWSCEKMDIVITPGSGQLWKTGKSYPRSVSGMPPAFLWGLSFSSVLLIPGSHLESQPAPLLFAWDNFSFCSAQQPTPKFLPIPCPFPAPSPHTYTHTLWVWGCKKLQYKPGKSSQRSNFTRWWNIKNVSFLWHLNLATIESAPEIL